MAYTKTNWINGETLCTAENMNNIENGIADLYDAIFPIGQIVIKGDNADYSNWLGFTWERTAVGKVLVGYNNDDTDFNEIGKTGGEKTHTLIVSELPSNIISTTSTGNNSDGYVARGGYTTDGTYNIGGQSQPHNNLQPYQVVAYWKRIS